MQLSALVFLAWFATSVSGDGLRTGYEKIMLFHAYQIDQLLPEAQQTIGIRCTVQPQYAFSPCPEPAAGMPKHERCKVEDTVFDNAGVGSTVQRPCRYLREFLHFIDDMDYRGAQVIRGTANDAQNRLDFDVDETARNLNVLGYDKGEYRRWAVYKDTSSPAHTDNPNQRTFYGMFGSVFDSVVAAKKNLPSAVYQANRHLFERFETARVGVLDTRLADNDRWWMERIAQREPTIRIQRTQLPWTETYRNPNGAAAVERSLYVYDELGTIDANEPTMRDIHKRLRDLRNEFITPWAARTHKKLIDLIYNGGVAVRVATPSCNAPN